MPIDKLTVDDYQVQEDLVFDKASQWREGFEAMGADNDTNSVEYMLPAAWDVLELAADTPP